MDVVKHSNFLIIGTCRHVVVDVLRGDPGLDALEVLFARGRELGPRYPEGVFFLNVLEARAFLPSPEQRKVMRDKIASLHRTTKATNLLVVEAKGFAAVAFRAVIAGISFLLSSPQTIYTSLDEAIQHILPTVPPAERVAFEAELRKTIEAVRAA